MADELLQNFLSYLLDKQINFWLKKKSKAFWIPSNLGALHSHTLKQFVLNFHADGGYEAHMHAHWHAISPNAAAENGSRLADALGSSIFYDPCQSSSHSTHIHLSKHCLFSYLGTLHMQICPWMVLGEIVTKQPEITNTFQHFHKLKISPSICSDNSLLRSFLHI